MYVDFNKEDSSHRLPHSLVFMDHPIKAHYQNADAIIYGPANKSPSSCSVLEAVAIILGWWKLIDLAPSGEQWRRFALGGSYFLHRSMF